MSFYDLLRRGATLDAAAAGAGVDRELAEVMVDHYTRAGLLLDPGHAPCGECAPRGPGCAGCPFSGGAGQHRAG